MCLHCYVFPSDESLLVWLYNNGVVIMVFSKQINSSITYDTWFLDDRTSTCNAIITQAIILQLTVRQAAIHQLLH